VAVGDKQVQYKGRRDAFDLVVDF